MQGAGEALHPASRRRPSLARPRSKRHKFTQFLHSSQVMNPLKSFTGKANGNPLLRALAESPNGLAKAQQPRTGTAVALTCALQVTT